jgi:pilus assembly protein CpaE
MTDKIRVLIVDDLPETRENVRKLLQFESDIEVVTQAGDGEQAVVQAKELKPDIILMDINMPGLDGITASRTISQAIPSAQIIIMSVQTEADYLRRAMLAGARDFLMKPFSGDELVTAVRRVYQMRPPVVASAAEGEGTGAETAQAVARPRREGKVIAVYSPKGGSGCTTIAINLAVALAQKGQRTAIIDGSLQFGDVAVMMNMKTTRSIIDLVERTDDLDRDLTSSVVLPHQTGVNVLMAPPRPEMADLVTEEQLRQIINKLRTMFDFIIVDTNTSLDENALAVLDTADRILLVTQQDLPSLKNVSRFFDLADTLSYEREKVFLIVNRHSKQLGISVNDVTNTLKRPVMAILPTDENTANRAADQGQPIVAGRGKKRPIGEALNKLGEITIRELQPALAGEAEKKPPQKVSFWAKLFGRQSQTVSG